MQNILATLPSGISVVRDPDVLGRYLTKAEQSIGNPPIAIVRPTDLAQLQDIVLWANQSRCSLAPMSSPGSDHRRGATPWSRPVLVVDLSGMNRVIHVDRNDFIAVIEPGVTFPEFDAALSAYGLRSFKPLLPRRNKSVLTSYLEREPTTSPHDHWDSEDPLGGLQVVFGSGEQFRTGTASVNGSLDEQLRKGSRQMMSIGPGSTDFLRVVQGSQGTLAIAAWAAAYCEPIPALEKSFFVGADEIGPLIELAYRVLWRRQGGQLFIVNDAHLAMMGSADRHGFDTLLPRLPKWSLYVNLTSPDYLPGERMSFLEADLSADAAKLGLTIADELGGYRASDIGAQQRELPLVQYKNRLYGAHRDIFFLTQLDQTPRFIGELGALLRSDEMQPGPVGVYLQPRVQGVSCHFEAVFPYDPANKAIGEKTGILADLAARRFADAGAFFSRPYEGWSDIAFGKDPSIKRYLTKVKEMFDPNEILSPGRLCF